ncbi:putative membrane protein [Scopulibacillus darangshiensis]|uniref:Putative membrane protein n=1 Tax=Scopulibacillus darangshiensis TaxID=442528 RepID=A0A4V2SNM7_9BACL|nr:DUF5808 domain-containing protein [Scopulibacillus darangshiensis]TCP31796.1 putative membrane protein [Scopulibacillus darangshiensis]
MMEKALVIMNLVMFTPVALLMIFTPFLTRKTESFGVSIPSDAFDSTDLTAMRKKYALSLAAFSVIIFAALAFISTYFAEAAFPVGLILFLVLSYMMYLRFHFRMKNYKREQNWQETRRQTVVIDTAFRSKKPTYSNAWFGLSFAIFLISLILSLVFYNRIPEKIPMQFDFDGNVTNWATKSYRTVMMFPAVQLYLIVLFVFINTMIAKAKQLVDPAEEEASIRKNLVFRRKWSLFMIISGTAMTLLFSLTQLAMIYPINQTILLFVSLTLSALIVIGAIWLSFRTGQGGSRLNTAAPAKSGSINRNDDRYWKLGQFYFNPNDPAVWIEKRFGIGWTVNFARPASWLTLIAIILIAVCLPIIFS